MRRILHKNLLRQVELLEILYKKDDYVTVGYLSRRLKFSEKIIRNDIKILNEDFKPFEIETSSRGVLLTFPPEYSIDFVYQKALSLSSEFLFLELVFFNEKYNLETISDKLFISTSSTRRIINKLNENLKKFDIQISNPPYKIIGNEGNILNFIIHYFYERYGIYRIPFPTIQVKVLDQILIYITKKNNILLNLPDLSRLRYWIMVKIIRLRHNHYTPIKEEFPSHINISIFNNKILCALFENIFQMKFNRENAHQLFYTFLNEKYAFDYKQLEALADAKVGNAYTVVNEINKLLSKISTTLNIPIQSKEKIVVELYNLQHMLRGPTYVLNNNRRYFNEFNSNEFAHVIQFLKNELKRITYHKDFKWTSYAFDEALYILIIHWGNLTNLLKDKTPPITIGLFCDSDIEHTLLIKDIISSYPFENFTKIHIIDELNISSIKKASKKYDLIITNVSGITDIQKPIICINTIPNKKDLIKIQNKIISLLRHNFNEM